ncbi:MAG: XRE family transcriptional regulator [Rubrivivax sp.]|nr:MAG: XRE family transcriptional regulator [Rubrivivax sp.]
MDHATSTPSRPTGTDSFGAHLRYWRQRRRLSQLALAAQADLSTRHLSCVETGRALPGRDVVLRLAERLEVPLRERNTLLVAAGYAPMYQQRRLDEPSMAVPRRAIELLLKAHEPYPALAIDRHWTLVTANAMVPLFLAGVDPSLLEGTVNVLRLSLHPKGLAPRIANLRPWRQHLLERLQHEIAITGDQVLIDLHQELASYPLPAVHHPAPASPAPDLAGLVVPVQLVTEAGILSFISTTTVFGTPVDVTLQELAIESFFPADEATAVALRQLRA